MCLSPPPPRFFKQRQKLPASNKGTGEKIAKKKKERRESQYSKCRREDGEYTHITKTRIVKVADGYVTFCQNFKYLGTWGSYSLRDDYDTTKQVIESTTAMVSLGKFWDDPHVNM